MTTAPPPFTSNIRARSVANTQWRTKARANTIITGRRVVQIRISSYRREQLGVRRLDKSYAAPFETINAFRNRTGRVRNGSVYSNHTADGSMVARRNTRREFADATNPCAAAVLGRTFVSFRSFVSVARRVNKSPVDTFRDRMCI